jgi:hypothetical protein
MPWHTETISPTTKETGMNDKKQTRRTPDTRMERTADRLCPGRGFSIIPAPLDKEILTYFLTPDMTTYYHP